MNLFRPDNGNKSAAHQRVYAIFAVWYTVVDFLAAFLFIIGSIFFFWKDTQETATWMFVFGSVFFALKPTLRLARELKLLSMGDFSDLEKLEQR